jgi:[histone H3]-trimethyl-L-lysine9/36 demethylase
MQNSDVEDVWLLLRAFLGLCRHTEDKDLASINYLHFGAPKMWYCIPPKQREEFEVLIKSHFPGEFKACPEFLRHKVSDLVEMRCCVAFCLAPLQRLHGLQLLQVILAKPAWLKKHNIEVVSIIQNPGEFIISAPGVARVSAQ